MKIIYHCYGAAHSSVIAAAIHLGRLPQERRPRLREILQLADYDQTETWTIGTLFFKGKDHFGHAVYTLGLGGEKETGLRAIQQFLQLLSVSTDDLFFHEALVHINILAKIGGALSRRYGWVKVGRPLSAFGIWLQYGRLVRFVQHVQELERQRIRLLSVDGRKE